MRGFHTAKTAEELLEGWTVHCNYFRPHVSLGRRTPLRAAGIRTRRNRETAMPGEERLRELGLTDLVWTTGGARPFSPSMASSQSKEERHTPD